MDNVEKLKIAKSFEMVLDRTEEPGESINRTIERLRAGEVSPEEIDRIRESFGSLANEVKADQQRFLQSRGFPPDLVKAVRLAMADLFGTFATTEEIEEFSMDKVWDLLQTAYDRRQWLEGIKPRNTPAASPDDHKRLKFYESHKARDSRLKYKSIVPLWNTQERESCDELAFKQSVYRARKDQRNGK